jgi:RNA polymerase sigma-B factor
MELSALDRDQLFATHRYLCSRGARRFWRRGLERPDLEQVAAIGLLKARDRYDVEASTPFAVYAWRLIVGELSHHVRAHEHLVRSPRRLQALERRYASEWERLGGILGREPGDRELAAALGTTYATALELRELAASRRRPDLIEAGTLADASSIYADTATGDVDDLLWLKGALARLSPLERRVVVGIYWCELPRTVLGRKLGLGTSAVANLHNQAVRRLRAHADRAR